MNNKKGIDPHGASYSILETVEKQDTGSGLYTVSVFHSFIIIVL